MSNAIKHKERSHRSYRRSIAYLEGFERHAQLTSMRRQLGAAKKQRGIDIFSGLRSAMEGIRKKSRESHSQKNAQS